IPMEPFAAENASQLRQRDRWVDPFQQEYIKQLEKEQEDKDTLDHSPGSGNKSFGVNRHPVDLRLQYTDCPLKRRRRFVRRTDIGCVPGNAVHFQNGISGTPKTPKRHFYFLLGFNTRYTSLKRWPR